jgi:hypothetical protein
MYIKVEPVLTATMGSLINAADSTAAGLLTAQQV